MGGEPDESRKDPDFDEIALKCTTNVLSGPNATAVVEMRHRATQFRASRFNINNPWVVRILLDEETLPQAESGGQSATTNSSTHLTADGPGDSANRNLRTA